MSDRNVLAAHDSTHELFTVLFPNIFRLLGPEDIKNLRLAHPIAAAVLRSTQPQLVVRHEGLARATSPAEQAAMVAALRRYSTVRELRIRTLTSEVGMALALLRQVALPRSVRELTIDTKLCDPGVVQEFALFVEACLPQLEGLRVRNLHPGPDTVTALEPVRRLLHLRSLQFTCHAALDAKTAKALVDLAATKVGMLARSHLCPHFDRMGPLRV